MRALVLSWFQISDNWGLIYGDEMVLAACYLVLSAQCSLVKLNSIVFCGAVDDSTLAFTKFAVDERMRLSSGLCLQPSPSVRVRYRSSLSLPCYHAPPSPSLE